MERTVLHEERRDGAAALVKARLDDGAAGGAVRVGLELADLGGQRDHLEQIIHAHTGLGGDRADDGVAAPVLSQQVVLRELLLDALGVRVRLIHLVDRHDDGDAGGLGVVDGFDRLRFDAVLGGDDEDGNIRDHRAAGTHGGERLMARGIEEGDGLALDLHLIGADVLRDAAGLAGGDVRVADIVEQARLAVVDVAHDDHDGARGLSSSAVSSWSSMSFSSMVTTTSFSTLQPSSSATKDAVSKSIIWESDAMTPFFIRHLTTSAPSSSCGSPARRRRSRRGS